jgi:hypothetical protein
MNPPSKTVAIVVPLSNTATFTPDEKISLRHLIHYLGRYDKYLIAPKSLEIDVPGFRIKRFPDNCFGSAQAHNRLVYSPKFYEAFSDYEYMLMHHLDSLVLSDQLMEWCGANIDYIGAPWLNCPDSPWVEVSRVGNGGFSLMKTQGALKVIDSPRCEIDPDEYWAQHYASQPKLVQWLNLPKKYLKHLRIFNCARWHMFRLRQSNWNNDHFWADEAIRYYPEFKIASVEQGLRFAFEVAPRMCFEMNGRKLPFGCHAWARYDRSFWEPYLLKESATEGTLPTGSAKPGYNR